MNGSSRVKNTNPFGFLAESHLLLSMIICNLSPHIIELIMKKSILLLLVLAILPSCNNRDEYSLISDVPDLTMPDNGLRFKEIENYKNYKIVATHFVTDNNELRYILANKKAFIALSKQQPFPEGSILVNIAWSVKNMSNFNEALEADEIQQIDYSIKDRKQFSENPGNWGYASFEKRNGKYRSSNEGTARCIACHNNAKETDYKFTKYQNLQ